VIALILILIYAPPRLPPAFEACAHLRMTEQVADQHLGDCIGVLLERSPLRSLIRIGQLESRFEIPEQIAVRRKDYS
jgi:hypothetical protein